MTIVHRPSPFQGREESEVLSLGQSLRKERLLRQVSLEELAQNTRIPLKMLQALEQDRFDELPGDIFARGFIRSYARALGVPAEPLLSRFSELFPPDEADAPVTALVPPERGRRFGPAVAVVILLVLFSLAMSVVLRPRHRETQLELSMRDAPALQAGAELASARVG